MPYLGETSIKEKPAETPAEVLARMDQRGVSDSVTLKRIAKNTSVLTDMQKGGAVSKRFAGKVISPGVEGANKKHEKATAGATERIAKADRIGKVKETVKEKADRKREKKGASVKPGDVESITPQEVDVARQRDHKGRFGSSNPKPAPNDPGKKSATLLGVLVKSAKGGIREHKGDIKEAAGRALLGGAGYEAAIQAKEAAKSLKEGMGREDGLVHDLKGWGKSKLGGKKDTTTTAVEKSENNGQKRHKEILQALGKGGRGGGAGSGAVGDGESVGGEIVHGAAEGASFAAVRYAKTALKWMLPYVLTLVSTPVIAGIAALITTSTALKSLMFGGSNFINDLYNKVVPGGGDTAPDPYTVNNSVMANTQRVNAERKAQGKKEFEYDPVTGVLDPNQFKPAIVNASDKNGLDPNLTKGLIQQESQFNPNARSKKGARGLMQLMPQTAEDLGVSDPTDPTQSIKGGTAHLGRLMRKYGGDETEALQAYNWGEGNMDAYLKTGRGVKGQPMPRETREFAGKVQGNKAMYEQTQSALPAKSDVSPLSQALPQPEPIVPIIPKPVAATVPGMDALISAISEQKSPRMEAKQQAAPRPIQTEFSDTFLLLLSHDRV